MSEWLKGDPLRKKKVSRASLKNQKTSSKKSSGQSVKKASSATTATLVKKVLFRPDRYQYVRDKKKSSSCVFCEAARQDLHFETLCVYKSTHSMILLNKFPYNSGHILIVPQSHQGHLLSLPEVEYQDLHQMLKLALAATESIYSPSAVNIGLNQGRAAGAGLPDHLHYHLIPRWEGDLNFFPLIAETKAVVETLEQTYKKFRDYFLENAP